ncbi:Interleukin-1 receptor-associated kinase 4 [Dermatophagoides farinae]|uniref:Interleukin-1 receptor-associated kinase 4 n=1 Tax=Dermatophagoides farinae TaxID=6954 RepID=A0A922HMU3_DERFA|nr:interleukin-1 receptor-associated kinase 4-like [Dermatophagoides farinae]KAH7644196.1 serine/threonine-kinase pelle-like protein [Dermatophagoides farinae]KAH9493935.1 Interleukin-1 receptor-associated kinase 4 [Dermatophagoides farinae]
MNNNSIHKELTFSTELRRLPANIIHQLIGLLDINDNWKLLAAIITNPDHPERFLFRSTDITILDEQRKRPGGSAANAMIQHWSTYGQQRHTIGDAIQFLEQSGLVRAAELIRNSVSVHQKSSTSDVINDHNDDIVKVSDQNWTDLPGYRSRATMARPTAPNESLMSFTTIDYNIDNHSTDQQDTTTTANSKDSLIRFSYQNLRLATDNFSSKNLTDGGTKLGEGSFGEVFRCATALLNHFRINDTKFVAVKRFKQLSLEGNNNDFNEFLAELNIMYHFRHPNLVRLFGYSDDGPNLCIVTEYMQNGSLYNYLFGTQQQDRRPLSFAERLRILTDIADAIVYLHTYSNHGLDKPFVHRDIKSANILLDGQLCARLGDLGLVRQGSNSNTETTIVTQTVKGTSVYMAPEAFRGDVSVKVDTFSFGVVSLELLTGMAAFDPNRDESDMVSYIDEMIGDEFDQTTNYDRNINLIESIKQTYQRWNNPTKLEQIFDQKCTDWPQQLATKLMILAKCCIEQRKRNRPTMIEVRNFLDHLLRT